MYLGNSGISVLDGVPDEVLKQLNQLPLVRQDRGQGVVRQQRATFFDRATQIRYRLLERFFAGNVPDILLSCPDPRIGQEILNRPLHAIGPVHRERNELVGSGIQLPFVPI